MELGGFKSMDDQEIKSSELQEIPAGEEEDDRGKRREELAARVSGAKAMKPKKLTLAHMFWPPAPNLEAREQLQTVAHVVGQKDGLPEDPC
jgi:hypothetical protein